MPSLITPKRAVDPFCRWLAGRMALMGVSARSLAQQLLITPATVYRYLDPTPGNTSLPGENRIPTLALVLGVSEAEVRKQMAAARIARGTLTVPADCVRESDTHLPQGAAHEMARAV